MQRARNIIFLILLGFILFAGAVRETYQVNPGICDGCAECAMSCPNGAIIYDMDLRSMRIDQLLCDGCGDCEVLCPRSAIYPNDARSFIVGTITNANTQFGLRDAVIAADTSSTISDMFGDYCLTLYEGSYDVICTAEGFEDLIVEDVVVLPDTAIRMDFVMVPQNDIEDDEIEQVLLDVRSFPNPVRAGSSVMLSLPESQFCTIDIYNALGQKVRTLWKSTRASSIIWDTLDERGKVLPSGVYLYRVRLKGNVASGKMLLVE